MVFNSLPSVTQELNNFFHQINKLTRFARSFVYFCEKNYLIPSFLRVRELKTICFFPSVSNDTFVVLCFDIRFSDLNVIVIQRLKASCITECCPMYIFDIYWNAIYNQWRYASLLLRYGELQKGLILSETFAQMEENDLIK